MPAPSDASSSRAVVRAFWSQDVNDLMAALQSSLHGLSVKVASARLKMAGSNTVQSRADYSAIRLLIRQFESPLVLILIFAACISMFLREWIDSLVILSIILGSTLLGFSQEFRASRAVADLKKRLALTVKVIRDGTSRTIPASDLVPGDVILLAAGHLVPADGIVIEAHDCLVSEASLTGESFPAEKRPGIAEADAPVHLRSNAVFLGTSVRSGTARVLVINTGRKTIFGNIAGRLEQSEPETNFERGVRHFGAMIVRVMILIVLSVLIVNQLLGRAFADSLLFSVALAVGLSPELLPAIISVTLSVGARHLAKGGVIVRRLEAIENLGSVDILCTDKTGTLSTGLIELEAVIDPEGGLSEDAARLAFVNSDLETGIENPLDAAVVAFAKAKGFEKGSYRKVAEIPYDFLRRRLTVVVENQEDLGRHKLICKGAFAEVLAVCSTLQKTGKVVPLDAAQIQAVEQLFRQRSEAGYRVLAVAERSFDPKASYGVADETDLTLIGLLLFLDPPKEQAKATIRDLAALGISIRIISGDNRYLTAHLATMVGLDPKALLTGADIGKMSDEALRHVAQKTTLFVEIDPQQKERIVRALQHAGHAVGYLGDGINDAPALRAADVGISVDQAVDVARESSDVILLQRDLDVLRQGIVDGRKTFANTLKYISITTSANFGNMVSMALATPFLPFLPLLPTQILLNNFLSGLPSMAIATDNVDQALLCMPQRWDVAQVRRFMIVFGLVSSCFDLLTFAFMLAVLHAHAPLFRTSWFVVSMLTQLAVVLVLRTHGLAWRSRPSQSLLYATVLVGFLCLLLPFISPVATLFRFVPLSLPTVVVLLGIVCTYVGATELAKRYFYRKLVETAHR
jgi:P-type Mg2+ transporter